MGKFTNCSWDDKQGNKRYTIEVVVNEMLLFGKKNQHTSLQIDLRLVYFYDESRTVKVELITTCFISLDLILIASTIILAAAFPIV